MKTKSKNNLKNLSSLNRILKKNNILFNKQQLYSGKYLIVK